MIGEDKTKGCIRQHGYVWIIENANVLKRECVEREEKRGADIGIEDAEREDVEILSTCVDVQNSW